MWAPRIVDHSNADGLSLECLVSGKAPMIVIRNFYDEKNCQTAAEKIKRRGPSSFQDGKLRHIGPFLMAHVTSKKKYFEGAKEAHRTLGDIFCAMGNPIPRIYETVGGMLPGHSVSLAREFQNDYSPAVIRIHEKGRSVPVHKDNVGYEGKEYALSGIDHQLSCVLHLQESESGGELIVYDRRWKKTDERFRNPDFGYSPGLTESSRSCRAPDIDAGDLVIINPGCYHEVTEITGDTPRITLGMFLGFYSRDCRIVAWA